MKGVMRALEEKSEAFEEGDLVLVGIENTSADAAKRNPYELETLMGMLRTQLYAIGQQSKRFPPFEKLSNSTQPLDFLWVEHFPLFEYDTNGAVRAMHHPFTSPQGITTVEGMRERKDVMSLLSNSCDLVLNGSEIGGG